MNKIKKIISFTLSFIFILCLIAGILAIFIPVDINKPTKKIMKQAHLDSVSIGKAKLHLPDDFKYKDLSISNKLSKTNTLNITLGKIHGDFRLFYTLSNRKDILKNLKGKFSWNFIQGKDYHIPFLYNEFSGKDTIFVPVIEKMKIKDSRIYIDSLGTTLLSINDITCNIVTENSNLPSFKVDLTSKSIQFYNLEAKNLKSDINVEKSKIQSSTLSGNIAGGTFKLEDISINPQKNLLCNTKISAKKVNIEKLLKVEEGTISGIINLQATVDTSFISLPKLKSKGNLIIKDLKAEKIPLLKKVSKLTDMRSLEKIAFNKFEADFHSEEGKVISDSIIATGKDFSLSGSGYIKPENQYFYYNVKGVFETHMKDSMSTLVWDALLPMKDGRKYFKCLIEGTPKNPSVHLKREMVKSAAKSLFKSIKNDFKSLFN